MSDVAYVYNPDDEGDSQLVNGVEFKLDANRATEVRGFGNLTAGEVADHIASKLGQWGVVRVSAPVEDGRALYPEDQEKVKRAEATYLRATMEWAEGLAMARAVRNKPRREAGLADPPLTEEERRAEEWLSDNLQKLRSAKLCV